MTMRTRPSRRGVTLIEGMIATVILLVGMVGIFQGMLIASVQNSMANRRTKATGLASELLASIDRKGYAWVNNLACSTTAPTTLGPSGSTVPYVTNKVQGTFAPYPSVCYIDVEKGGTQGLPIQALTPSFNNSPTDSLQFRRLVTIYRGAPASSADYYGVIYVAVSVEWREGGSARVVEKLTALNDTAVNQTNIEF